MDVTDGGGGDEAATVVVADDHAVVRAGVRLLLAEDPALTVVGEAADLPAAIAAVEELRPAVLVLDLHMAGVFTLAALPQLLAASPGTGVLVFTMQQEPAYAVRSLAAGARGYLRKDAGEGELLAAVRAIAAGRTYLDTELGATLAVDTPPTAPHDRLSDRQRTVLAMVARGTSNRAIARELGISVRTVESLRAQIRERLGLSTQADLIAYAWNHDI